MQRGLGIGNLNIRANSNTEDVCLIDLQFDHSNFNTVSLLDHAVQPQRAKTREIYLCVRGGFAPISG